jgi:hypothetical protein
VRPPWFSNPASSCETDLDCDVPDQAVGLVAVARVGPDGVEVNEPSPGEGLLVQLIRLPEQLVTTADGEHNGAAPSGLMKRRALGASQVVCAQPLVVVLAAADVVEVGAVRVESLADRGRTELKADAAPAAAALQQ